MRAHFLIHLTVVGALALGAACRDAAAPEQVSSAGITVTPDTTSTPQASYDAVWLNFGAPGLLVGDSALLSAQVLRGRYEAFDTLAWETNDASIASVETVGKNVVLIRALRSGSVAISARTQSAMPDLSTRLDLQVFARSNAASPIVVDEFSILQSLMGNGAVYHQPKLRLRDTSAAGTARVIGLAIDVPQIGGSVFCSSNQTVGASGWSAFNPPGDMNYGFSIVPRGPGRAGEPTVRVIAVLSDGFGVSFTATGKIELATPWQYYDGDDTGVRCQP